MGKPSESTSLEQLTKTLYQVMTWGGTTCFGINKLRKVSTQTKINTQHKGKGLRVGGFS